MFYLNTSAIVVVLISIIVIIGNAYRRCAEKG